MLNVSKTKELIVDLRTQQRQRTYTPLGINGTAVERVSSFRYLAFDFVCGERRHRSQPKHTPPSTNAISKARASHD